MLNATGMSGESPSSSSVYSTSLQAHDSSGSAHPHFHKSGSGCSTSGSSGGNNNVLLRCPLCEKVFTNSSAIAKHKLTHSEQRKYICDVCGKAFKRQDHLNGHKLTHQNRKPHECRLCDKSFSDSRSLRRHYENQHGEQLHQFQSTNKVLPTSNTSMVSSTKSLPDTRNNEEEVTAIGELLNPLFVPKNVFCSVCGKGFKNLAALNGHMRLHGGYSSVAQMARHVSPSSAYLASPSPALHTPVSSPLAVPKCGLETCANFSHSPYVGSGLEASTGVDAGLDLLENLDLNNFIDIMEECEESKTDLPSVPISTSQSSVSDELLEKLFIDSREYPGSSSLMKMDPNYPVSASLNNTTNSPHSNSKSWFSHIPMGGSAVSSPQGWQYRACHFTFEPAHVHLSKQLSSNTLGPTWDDRSSKPPPPSPVPFHPRSSSSAASLPTRGGPEDFTSNTGITPTSSLTVDTSLGEGFSSYIFRNPLCRPPFKKTKCKPSPIHIPPQCNASVSRLRSPRLFGGPLSAGPHLQHHNGHHQPPYTPFPMLSPHRQGTGLYARLACSPGCCKAHRSTPVTPGAVRTTLDTQTHSPHFAQYGGQGVPTRVPSAPGQPSSSWTEELSSLEEYQSSLGPTSSTTMSPGPRFSFDADDLNWELSTTHRITVVASQPMGTMESTNMDPGLLCSALPAINIGSAFQAQLPTLCSDVEEAQMDPREYETLVWDPVHMITDVEKAKSLDLLMKMACSPAIRDCGFNLESTFNLVCKHKGDLDAALKELLKESFAVHDHIYAESSSWTSEEIVCFQETLRRHSRDFHAMSRELQSRGVEKSVKACVEFYYMWKRVSTLREAQTRSEEAVSSTLDSKVTSVVSKYDGDDTFGLSSTFQLP